MSQEDSHISTEPMGLREAVRYGASVYLQAHKEMAPYRRSQDRHVYDLSTPSAQAEPIVITSSLMRAALSVQHHLAREEGKPYDADLLAEVEADEATRGRFLASNWSWLFPKLKHPKVIDIRLDRSE